MLYCPISDDYFMKET